MSENKKIIISVAFVCFFIIMCNFIDKNEAECKVIVNGQKTGISAEIKDGAPYLSIQDVGTICLASETICNTDKDTGTIKILNYKYSFQAGQKKYLLSGSDGYVEELQFTHIPYTKKKLYLPVEILADEFGAHIDWHKDKNNISIEFDIEYGTYYDIDKKMSCCVINYSTVHEPTLSQDYLVIYYHNGKRELLARFWRIDEIKVKDGICYVLARQYGFGEQLKIYAVDLREKNIVQLGDLDFVYNRPIITEYHGVCTLGVKSDLIYDWHIEADGVYIVGFSQKALYDDVIGDIELAKQTYGLWCLDKSGDGQRLVEKIPFTQEKTTE